MLLSPFLLCKKYTFGIIKYSILRVCKVIRRRPFFQARRDITEMKWLQMELETILQPRVGHNILIAFEAHHSHRKYYIDLREV